MGRIDRKKVVKRHNPILTAIDYESPLTVGNGFFAYTFDITGMQSLGRYYARNRNPVYHGGMGMAYHSLRHR